MEKQNRFVSIQIGRHIIMEFNASILDSKDAQHVTYYRITDTGIPAAGSGTIHVDEEHAKIGFLYDILQMIVDIQDRTKIGDNLHYKCIANFGRVDLYICNPEEWKKDGDKIFAKKA